MNVQFRASFSKDLRNIKNKNLLYRIKEVIEHIEKAQNLQDISNLKKLKGRNIYYRVRVGDYRIGLTIENNKEFKTDTPLRGYGLTAALFPNF
ncbi:MAG: hypothetical protein A2Z59_00660 [Nitrospinae bacterium RIFCSPLOWO2_02_39_17]|nr:MAG: hypothetical protein A3D20_00535 [Nitrospinae bacterium RIFCSPHIGHO2_02_FULL_39_82]OGW02044.1 MAG: hypothetical protein A2Z59_00660 [Nitrospinae bacterium RIFCSPLOWO2_02_39_17]OGW10910.1 MAG: hypothetical protein A2W75_10420 [Nitrospinae bacterium RIFCSPLOWO2_12_39_15]